MHRLIISNTINNVKDSFTEVGLDHDSFMTELAKHQGVIAGSFMFMNFAFVNTSGTNSKNFLGAAREFNDIDVYLQYHLCDKKPTDQYYYDDCYHPFEKYIMNNITTRVGESESYMFTDGIVLSRIYTTKKIKINVVLVNQPLVQFINENFDLDCCKIIYDGTTCTVFNPDELSQGISRCKYNKCSLDHIYKDAAKPDYSNNKIYKSDAFKKFKLLYEAFVNSKIPNSFTIDPDYNRYMTYISQKYDLTKIFGESSMNEVSKIKLTDDIVKIISMLRTHERIDKYKQRGIVTVLLDIGTIII